MGIDGIDFPLQSLFFGEAGVDARLTDELFVGSLFCDAALVEDDDMIAAGGGGDATGDEKDGSSLGLSIDGF